MEYNFGNLNIFNSFIYLLLSTLINKIHTFSACSARDTHQIAEAQQQKNAKLREARPAEQAAQQGDPGPRP